MSKESRRQRRLAASASTADPAASAGATSTGATSPGASSSSAGSASAGSAGARPSTSPSGTPRAGRRVRSRASAARPSFLERYRNVLIAVGGVAVAAIVGVGLFSAATSPVFACSNIWVPDPTPPPGADASPQPGYAQPDMGETHVGTGSTVTYTYCPPATGRHWNAQGNGPIAPRVYGPNDIAHPQGWVHNLEHGALVLLYRGDGPGATEVGQAALRDFFDRYPPSPVCGFEAGTTVGPVFARFDEMATPFAAMVWGRVLPLETMDEAAILEFDQAFGERTNPEQFCSPNPSPSVAPSGSPAASPSPSAS